MDITNRSGIQVLVDRFYEKVKTDALLGPIFHAAVGRHWDQHLHRMYDFWETVLLDEQKYHGHPFRPHMKLPIEHKHFERWLALFRETVNEHFDGEKAREAVSRAELMAKIFESKLAFNRPFIK